MSIDIGKFLARFFGSRNDRLLKRYRRLVEQINAWEPKVQVRSDAELAARTAELRQALLDGKLKPADVMPEAFAIIRESMDRHIGIRNIFNPEESFNPDDYKREQFDDAAYEAYDRVQQAMIATGQSWQQVAIPTELYAAVRKIFPESRPPFRARCFDVQLIGGVVLYEGKIAEMATGEGKTFVAPLACFMKALEGNHCHVVTVNDYLVKRDANWVRPAFENLGMTVGFIQAELEPGGDGRKRSYRCDVTYGTASEFGFDYLRDNMKERLELQVQGPLHFAIIDEVDSILIDEARTPLIISGAAHDDAPKYRSADAVARKVLELHKPYSEAERAVDAAKRAIKAAEGDEEKTKVKAEKDAARVRRAEAEKQLAAAEANLKNFVQYYEVELDRKSVHLTHEGIAAAQEAAGVGSFYTGANMEWPHLMEQSLRAHVVYERDRDYVVERGPRGDMEVVIVDEYTGRKMVGRQWSDGLHQAVEAKERVTIKQETQTLATITLQNFFKLYRSIAGMTGTAQTEAEEFNKIYRLEVVTIPTNRPVIRADHQDRVYRSEREKWDAIIEEIKLFSDAGRPVLVGTTSVEKSEMLSKMLKQKYGIEHEVLNARYHEREAQIVVKAGQQHRNAHGEVVGNVTIATNMAGRGTDIKPAPETFFDVESREGSKIVLKQRATAKSLTIDPTDEKDRLAGALPLAPSGKVSGGLHVIGTERHTARRIDNQLRGRSGRQGDAGSSRFYISLQDDLMKMFAGEWTIKVLGFLGMEEGMAIEDKRISKGILRAQKKVEERNFLGRKNLLEYDEVMDKQRTIFYGTRQTVLEGRNIDRVIWDMIGESIEDAVDKYVAQDYVAATIAEWARVNFDVAIDPSKLHGLRRFNDVEDYIKGQAKVEVETNLSAQLREYMGEDPDDNSQWDMKALQSFIMSHYHVQVSLAQLRTMKGSQVEEAIKEAALEQIDQRDAAGVAKYLEPNHALAELAGWAASKFDVKLEVPEMLADAGRGLPKTPQEIVALVTERARQAYAPRELEYPVDHALAVCFGPEATSTDNAYAAEYLRNWAGAKFGMDLDLAAIRAMSLRELREALVREQERWLRGGRLEQEVDALLTAHADEPALLEAFNRRFYASLTPLDLHPRGQTAAREGDVDGDGKVDRRDVLLAAARRFFRRELTDLEQFVLIQIFDQSWKDHLYVMDMLKTGIGLQAFAERDPRIAYKREGFRAFKEMMAGVRDKVTDLIFRARIFGQTERRSAYQVTGATGTAAAGYGVSETVAREEQASGAAEPEAKPKTIVREAPKVGRNDPCPCGSGKKYKKCCGANEA